MKNAEFITNLVYYVFLLLFSLFWISELKRGSMVKLLLLVLLIPVMLNIYDNLWCLRKFSQNSEYILKGNYKSALKNNIEILKSADNIPYTTRIQINHSNALLLYTLGEYASALKCFRAYFEQLKWISLDDMFFSLYIKCHEMIAGSRGVPEKQWRNLLFPDTAAEIRP